jgi:hypothetical protein
VVLCHERGWYAITLGVRMGFNIQYVAHAQSPANSSSDLYLSDPSFSGGSGLCRASAQGT